MIYRQCRTHRTSLRRNKTCKGRDNEMRKHHVQKMKDMNSTR
jgi:hypothetical protein